MYSEVSVLFARTKSSTATVIRVTLLLYFGCSHFRLPFSYNGAAISEFAGADSDGIFFPRSFGGGVFFGSQKKKKSLHPPTSHTFADRSKIERTTPAALQVTRRAFYCPNPTGFFFPPAFCLTILLYNLTQKTIWLPYVRHTTISLQCTAAGRTFSTNNRSTVMISGVRFLRRLFRPLKSPVHDARPGGGGPPSLLYDSFVPVISHKRQNIIT